MKTLQDTPKFVINPTLVPTCWQGENWGYRAHRNKNYLNSVWLGTVWNVFLLPQRIWHSVGVPLLHGRVIAALVNVPMVPVITLAYFCAGIIGSLKMLPYDLPTLMESYVLSEEEGKREIEHGSNAPLRPY